MEILSDNWNLLISLVLGVAIIAVVAFTIRRDRLEEEGEDPMEPYAEVAEAERRLRPHPKAPG